MARLDGVVIANEASDCITRRENLFGTSKGASWQGAP